MSITYPSTFELPTTDKLTGLLSGLYFRHLLRETLLPQVQASGEPLSLVMIDLDRFLEQNTAYGQAAGDWLLTAVADTLRSVMPESAVLGRYGGDELAAA